MLRDGTMTYVDICRPDAAGGFPALMMRTPYNKSETPSRAWAMDMIRAAQRGYAVVLQDIRGRHSSEGEFYPFVNEASDGYDSIEWVASQSWCSGKVGMFGSSYNGATQWLAASAKPSHLGGYRAGSHGVGLPRGVVVAGGSVRAWVQHVVVGRISDGGELAEPLQAAIPVALSVRRAPDDAGQPDAPPPVTCR